MPRFFVSPEDISENWIHLSKDDVNHIINVLRLKEGERITVCDSQSNDYECELSFVSKKELELKILNCEKNKSEAPVHVTLYQGLPKQDKMELIIQKCVELGISEIVPVSTERAVVKLKGDGEKKLNRWQKIAESAAKQSGRGIIPKIQEPVSFKTAVEQMKESDLALIPYELEREKGLKQILPGFKGERISVFIGPEGGFSSEEIDYALDGGIVPVTLGRRILRTETAGFAALTVIMYEIGDI